MTDSIHPHRGRAGLGGPAAVLVALVLLATACGGSSHPRSAPAGATITPGAATSTPPTSAAAAPSGSAGPTTTAASASTTRVLYASPVDLGGAARPGMHVTSTLSGRCHPGSDAVGNVTVYLPAGGRASALVGGSSGAGCATYASLLVTAPGTRTSGTVKLTGAGLPGCTVQVHPVVTGSQAT